MEADKPITNRLLDSVEDERGEPLESLPAAVVAEVVQRIVHDKTAVPRVPVATFGSSI